VRFAVENGKASVNSCHSDRLCDVALANAGISEQQNVFMLFDESPAGKLEDQRSIHCVKLPIERVERSLIAKAGFFDSPLEQSVATPLQLVVDKQGEEIHRS
jgi:hypothetical protein